MCYLRGFIWCEKAAFSLNYGIGASRDAVRVLKTIRFCNTTFLIIEKEFSRLIAWLLSFMACWVNFVNASIWPVTNSDPPAGAKMAAKWSYHWITDPLSHTDHLAYTNGKFSGAISKLASKWPWVHRSPRVHLPMHPGRSQGHWLVPQIHWVLLGATQYISNPLSQSVVYCYL